METLVRRLCRVVPALVAALCVALPALAAERPPVERVIVVTLDGVRCQDLFGGAQAELMVGKPGEEPDAALARRYLRPTPGERREALMPFFWRTVARQGQVFGDASRGSGATLTNGLWFSFPGYSEMLTGAADPRVNSNDKVPNPNVNVFEFLNGLPAFRGKVETLASWDAAPAILNEGRSGLPVNVAPVPFDRPANARQRTLNAVAADLPTYWGSERSDAVTMQAALEILRSRRPRVLYVMLGDTDEWAHGRRYDLYLEMMAKSDRFIRTLWEAAQALPEYKGRTALVIATDHGRGATAADWTDHGEKVPAAQWIWMAAMGPGIPALGVREATETTLGQVAATVASLLGEDFHRARPAAAPPLPLSGK